MVKKVILAGVYFCLFSAISFGQAKKAQQLQKVLTPKEEARVIQQTLKKIENNNQLIKKLLNEATKKKEVIAVDCIFDKWSQAQGLTQLARNSAKAFDKAQKIKRQAESKHFFRKTVYLAEKISVLRDQAGACVGRKFRAEAVTGIEVIESGSEEDEDTNTTPPLDQQYPQIPPVSPWR